MSADDDDMGLENIHREYRSLCLRISLLHTGSFLMTAGLISLVLSDSYPHASGWFLLGVGASFAIVEAIVKAHADV